MQSIRTHIPQTQVAGYPYGPTMHGRGIDLTPHFRGEGPVRADLLVFSHCVTIGANMLSKKKKGELIEKVQVHKTDTGSSAVQVGILTERIAELTKHLKKNKKDTHSRRGLLQMVADRRTHLKYLQKSNVDRYEKVVKKLGLK